MKKSPLKSLIFVLLALAVSGCATSSDSSPWAPAKKKKPFAERWDERAKQAEEDAAKNAVAEEAPVVKMSASTEIATVVFADNAEKVLVAYPAGSKEPFVKKGDIFALRGKDMVLHGVVRLDMVGAEGTLGFALLGGTAGIGDMVTIPGEKLLDVMKSTYPECFEPEK